MEFNETDARHLITKHRLRQTTFYRWRKAGLIPDKYSRIAPPSNTPDEGTEQTEEILFRMITEEQSLIKAASLGKLMSYPTKLTEMGTGWRRSGESLRHLTRDEATRLQEWIDGLYSIVDDTLTRLQNEEVVTTRDDLWPLLKYPGISIRALCRSLPRGAEGQLTSILIGKNNRVLSEDIKFELSLTLIHLLLIISP